MLIESTRQVRDPEAARRVVEAAWRAVASRGVDGASIRVIAEEAGVTTGSVTHYFPGKQALLAEVLRHNNQRAAARVASELGDRRGLDAVKIAVESVLPFGRDRKREWQVWIAAWTTSSGNGLAAGLREGWTGLRAILRRGLEQAVEDGEIAAGTDLDYEADRLVAMAAGIGLAAGVGAPTARGRPARQMVGDHLAGLRSA